MRPSLFLGAACLPLVAGCGPHVVHVAHAVPATVQVQLMRAPRVWVAGFVTNANVDRIDLNRETVRLVRQALKATGTVPVVDSEPLIVANERVFDDDAYWRRLGEEHGSPLIVTGSIKLFLAPPAIVQRGMRTVYVPTAGRVLDATIVLIDGRDGRVIGVTTLARRMRYGVGRFSSGLSLYFELMDRSRVDWFEAIAGQTVMPAGLERPIGKGQES
jgi:hypothetical protein